MKLHSLCLCASVVGLLAAAEPNWPAVETEALAFVQQYIRIPSINPPSDTSVTAKLIHDLLQRHGIPSKLYVSGPAGQTNLLARLPGRDRSKKPLMLMNHMDVVPVDRAAWKLDPFAATIKDGQLWGRGAMDMKGLGTQQMMAFIALKESGVLPARDVLLLVTTDEESNGTFGIRWMIDNHRSEIDAAYVLDEGGFGSRELLSPGKLAFGIAVGEKQSAWLRLRAKGTAAHGSQPIEDNANLTLLKALVRAMETKAGPTHPVVTEMYRNLGTLAKNKYTAAIQGNTISLTTLESGVGSPKKVNVIPSAAEATLDCRLLPGVNAQEFVSEIRARINDPRVTVELLTAPEDPGASPADTPLFAAIRKAILAQHPGAIVTPMLVPHGTDSVKLRKLGVTAYGLTPMVLTMETAGSMHSDTEHIPVAEFLKGIRIFYDVLRGDW